MKNEMSSFSETIFKERYAHPGESTWDELAKRVADHVAKAEASVSLVENEQAPRDAWAKKFKKLISDQVFIPGGRILYGSGRNKAQLLNCISGDTLVYTEDGLKRMDEIIVGDYVLTHQGRYRKVLRHWSNGEKDIIGMTRGRTRRKSLTIGITPEHRIFDGDQKWTEASKASSATVPFIAIDSDENMKEFDIHSYFGSVNGRTTIEDDGRVKCLNKDPERSGKYNDQESQPWARIKNDVELARLFGLYVAEGACNGTRVYFTYNSNEREYIDFTKKTLTEKFGIEAWEQNWDDQNFTQVSISSRFVQRLFIDNFKVGCTLKRLPKWIFNQSTEYKQSFLDGFMDGDGFDHGKSKSAALANPTLVYEVLLLARSIGYKGNFFPDKMRELSKNPTSEMRIGDDPIFHNLVKTTDIIDTCEVFDMEVEEDHSFVAGDFICHNCFLLDVEDNRESIGKLFSDFFVVSGTGGGVGVNFSKLRPKGGLLSGIGGAASGPISFMRAMDKLAETVRAGGSRRAALLMALDVTHPDVLDFIDIKLAGTELANANISITFTQEFIDAVKNDSDWEFEFNGRKYPIYEVDRVDKDGVKDVLQLPATDEIHAIAIAKGFHDAFGKDYKFTVKGTTSIKAKYIWDKAIENQMAVGDPGFMNLGYMNEMNNLYYTSEIRGTNPCVSGDTLVAVADGRNFVSMKELTDNGKDVPVYTIDDDGKNTIEMMRNPRVTGHNQQIYKIRIDDGHEVRVTGNHKFRLKDGQYIEASKLKPGDSLHIMTKYEASFEDIFKESNSKSSDYMWINNGDLKGSKSEHRMIYEYNNDSIHIGDVIHHKDFNSLNNSPENLISMTRKDHDAYHGERIKGKKNPYHRMTDEWKHDFASHPGDANHKYSGITNKEIMIHAKELTKKIGRRFSKAEWIKYAKENNIPQSFSEYRKEAVGTVANMAKRAALELGYENNDLDLRVLKTYKQALENGYDAKIDNSSVIVSRICETCGDAFDVEFKRREQSFCSRTCSLRSIDDKKRIESVRLTYKTRGCSNKEEQVKIFCDISHKLGRRPLKKEWENECRVKDIPFRLNAENGFKTYDELEEVSSTYNHKVVSVELDGLEDVYNGTVDKYHNFFIGGFEDTCKNGKPKYLSLNNLQCGEIPLGPNQCCCLGAINLSELVQTDSEGNDTFSWTKFKHAIHTSVRFLDDVLDVNQYPLQTIEQECKTIRRIGLGVMGLHHMLIKLGYKYGDDTCLEFIDRLFEKLRDEAYTASTEIAIEKGSFPRYDREKFLKSKFIKSLPTRIKNRIKNNGIRNSVIITIAPTGTTSIVVGASSGIEPIFSPIYKRRYYSGAEMKEELVADGLFAEEYSKGRPVDHIVGAYDITPEQHIAVQQTIQRYTDNSLSKTINLPKDYTNTAISELLIDNLDEMKGTTFYRAGSKDMEPLVAIPISEIDDISAIISNNKEEEVADGTICKLGDKSCGS